MAALIIVGTAIILGVILFKPKLGTFLVWPLMLCYPHGWWTNMQLLPWNMGFDDLYCLVLFLVVIIRRNMSEGVPVRFGYAFWCITSFIIITIISIWSGSTYIPSVYRIFSIKDIMKEGVYWALFYSVLHCIDNVDDLTRQIKYFTLAAVAGAVLVILHKFFPRLMEPWTLVNVVGLQKTVSLDRASGAFGNANSAACFLVCSLVFVITLIRLQRKPSSKVLFYSFVIVFLLAIMTTKSRSGLTALMGTFLLIGFFGKARLIAWLVIAAGIIVPLFASEIRGEFLRRIEDVYDPATGAVAINLLGRIDTWTGYLETMTGQTFFLGQGFRAGIQRNVMESHSAYVSLLANYGIGGVIWGIIGGILFIKKVRFLRFSADPLLATIASGCFWALLAWAIYGFASDAFSAQYSRYFLFYAIVLIDRAHHFDKGLEYADLESEIYYEPIDYPDEAGYEYVPLT